MKYLTAPYLSLMNAFKDHSDDVISQYENQKHYSRIALMQEYRTLRLDGGRQTGKTEAASMFAKDWIEDGGQVIVLADSESYAKNTGDRIIRKFPGLNTRSAFKNQIFTQSIRTYLSDSCSKRYHGVALKNTLIIIEEPCAKMPEIYKFYKAFEDHLMVNTITGGCKLPLFFVMGIQ